MRTIREIYATYEVPPWLQMHQLRVAAVGKMVAENLDIPTDVELVTATCLVHDIGSIVKFDFSFVTHTALQDLVPVEERERWRVVQDRVRSRYGATESEATNAILNELGREDIRNIYAGTGLSNIERLLSDGDNETRIVQYADMRAGPHGIISVRERLAEAEERYAVIWKREGRFEEMQRYGTSADALEAQLFAKARIRPEDISDASVAPLIEALWDYEIA